MSLPPPPDLRRLKRLLLIRLSSIGDVVHCLPVSAALGTAFPHLRISWLVEERAAPMVLGNPYVHDVVVLPSAWRNFSTLPSVIRPVIGILRRLRRARFDVAIDLQGLGRSALMAWASGARYRYGWDWLRELAPWLVTRVPRRPESRLIVDQMLDVARYLGAPVTEVAFPLHIAPCDEDAAARMLAKAGIGAGQSFLAINPTEGGYGHKGWGVSRLASLLKELAKDCRLPVVMIGGCEDMPLADALARQTCPRPANFAGRTTLKELAAILRRASLHLCGDTGTAQIAAAVGTPVVTIFGRTDPSRTAPYGQEKWVVHHRDRCVEACRRVRDTAPFNNPHVNCLAPPSACLAAVTVAEVAATIRRCLGETAREPISA